MQRKILIVLLGGCFAVVYGTPFTLTGWAIATVAVAASYVITHKLDS